ncbi:hypothetical protein NKZ03_31305, partial [Sinorhizobium meliloti]|uniref:hypothetical protein n=1 Tax=Rhizobium meliloti TaxID=382 RepID=UPI001AEBB493
QENGLSRFGRDMVRHVPAIFEKKRLSETNTSSVCFVSTPENTSKDKSNERPEYPHPPQGV